MEVVSLPASWLHLVILPLRISLISLTLKGYIIVPVGYQSHGVDCYAMLAHHPFVFALHVLTFLFGEFAGDHDGLGVVGEHCVDGFLLAHKEGYD